MILYVSLPIYSGEGKLWSLRGRPMSRILSTAVMLAALVGCGSGTASSTEVVKASLGECSSSADCTGEPVAQCEVCSDGESVCAHFTCEGGACVTQTCACTVAQDCHGALPDICRLCGDGTSACAHWTCSAGTCLVGMCP
jgi:hypothetical protein